MKKVSKKIAEADKIYNHNINILVNELLPNYENTCLKAYLKLDEKQEVEDKLIFGSGKEDKLSEEREFMVIFFFIRILDNIKLLKKKNSEVNHFEIVYHVLKTEIKEIEAFQETIAGRDQWEIQMNKLIQKNKDYQSSLQNLSKGSAMANFLALGNKHESMHTLKENIAKVDINTLI